MGEAGERKSFLLTSLTVGVCKLILMWQVSCGLGREQKVE